MTATERVMKMSFAKVMRCIMETNPEVKDEGVMQDAYQQLFKLSKETGTSVTVYMAAIIYSLWNVAAELDEKLNRLEPGDLAEAFTAMGFHVVVVDENDETFKC